MAILTIVLLSTLVLSASANSWAYVDGNQGIYMPALPFPNGQLKYKLLAGPTSNQVTALELECLDEGPGYHSHVRESKMYRVMEGRVQFIVNGTQFCAREGDFVYVPPFVGQTFRVYNPTLAKKRVRVQLVFYPAGVENFLNDMTTLFVRGNATAAEYNRTAKKHLISTLGPVTWEDLGCFDDTAN